MNRAASAAIWLAGVAALAFAGVAVHEFSYSASHGGNVVSQIIAITASAGALLSAAIIALAVAVSGARN